VSTWRSRELRTNCLFWSLRQWARRGGYLCVRRGLLTAEDGTNRPGYYWHFAWLPRRGRAIYHFQPAEGQMRFPYVWMLGYIQCGEKVL
jgi:hypothetical protein